MQRLIKRKIVVLLGCVDQTLTVFLLIYINDFCVKKQLVTSPNHPRVEISIKRAFGWLSPNARVALVLPGLEPAVFNVVENVHRSFTP